MRRRTLIIVAASNDAELRTFFKTLTTGTDTEQQAAVDAAADKALRWMNRK